MRKEENKEEMKEAIRKDIENFKLLLPRKYFK